jgi:hypothetical protein
MSARTKAAIRHISRTSIYKLTLKAPTPTNAHIIVIGRAATRVFSHRLVSRDTKRRTKGMRDFGVQRTHHATKPSGSIKLSNAISVPNISNSLHIPVSISIRSRVSPAILDLMEQLVSASTKSASTELPNSSVHNA